MKNTAKTEETMKNTTNITDTTKTEETGTTEETMKNTTKTEETTEKITFSGSACAIIRQYVTYRKGNATDEQISSYLSSQKIPVPAKATIRTQRAEARRALGLACEGKRGTYTVTFDV